MPQLAHYEDTQGLPVIQTASLQNRLHDYFDKAGVLLLELKNTEFEQDRYLFKGLKKASRELLDESVLLKADLESQDMALITGLIEKLELSLYEIADIDTNFKREDLDHLKASIVHNDLLIKIEVIDLKSALEQAKAQEEERLLNETL